MPRRDDIKKIFIIGSGPIVIGQACEFDYSGSQACKTLLRDGYEVVLVNSNPATIMTDPEYSTRTYIEPLCVEVLEKIIEKERPQALLPTLGGQTALNLAIELWKKGILQKYNVEMIGANYEVIRKAEEREQFKSAMQKIGLYVPKSGYAKSWEDARRIAEEIGSFPLIIRPSFTLGGTGGGTSYSADDYEMVAKRGLDYSPIHQILIEESVIGWKEYELEVMRDKKDNVVIVCSIENLDPMGIHTGDSITVAPAQTLTDKEYQIMRDAAIAIIREIGVETGGSNIQFAINQDNGKMAVIEMNPRVSRSSALASKATGFPIAKIAAKLAVGYTLDEIPNDITRETMASFEPAIDYCVVKIPRWAFEKFPQADPTLTIQMKSVGEVMAIGRTFKEAFQKGIRSLEIDRFGWGADGRDPDLSRVSREEIERKLRVPNADRIFYIRYAFRKGYTIDQIYELTKIDRWFLNNLSEILDMEGSILGKKKKLTSLINKGAYKLNDKERGFAKEFFFKIKQFGFSDVQLACLLGYGDEKEDIIREFREELGVEAVFKLVDTCAAEFEAYTPYYYSTYELEDECRRSNRKKIMILGGGPNRIGQGIEFDYCCVHASFALKEDGYETIMVNCNPETVSTDYDTSDKLYFEPLTKEDVLTIYRREKCHGAIVQFGGQTPLNLAVSLEEAGVNIIGTTPESIDRAEDRQLFKELLNIVGLLQPPNGTATNVNEAKKIAKEIGYPVLVRPSYVLGGRAMEIVYDEESLLDYMARAVKASPKHPVLIDKYLENAIEVDVDAIADGKKAYIAAIMEHIEHAGVHSGDSACVIPPFSLSDGIVEEIRRYTYSLAKELNVIGLMNVQYAVKGSTLYVLEVNPRASRTIPFVSKATGVPFAKLAARVMAGKTLDQLGFRKEAKVDYFSVKEAILPFARFPGQDILLGPEMKSTGEVMGIDYDFGIAYAKTQFGSGNKLPTEGTVFISVKDEDKRIAVFFAKKLYELGFKIIATNSTAQVFEKMDIEVTRVRKIKEGHKNILDYIIEGSLDLIINTPGDSETRDDERLIRSTAVRYGISCFTTMAGAAEVIHSIETLKRKGISVCALQDYHKTVR